MTTESPSRPSFLRDMLARLRAFSTPSTLVFALVWVALTALYLWPVLGNRYVPSQDMGNHLAMVNLWRSLGNSPVVDWAYEARPGYQPYLLHYASLRTLGAFMPLERANQVVLALYVVALPLSLLYLFTRFGKDRRYALLTFPFIYNAYFIYGFLANLAALPLLFLVLGQMKSYLDHPKLWREVLLTISLLLLTTTHVLVLASFAVAAPVIFFAHVHRPLQIVRRSLFVLPSALLGALWMLSRPSGGKLKGYWDPLEKTFMGLVTWTNDIFLDDDDQMVLLAVVLTVGLILLLPRDDDGPRSPKEWSLPAAGLALLLAYLVAPTHMVQPTHWATGARLVLPAFLLLLAIPQVKLDRWRQLVLVPGLAFVVWGGYQTWTHFHEFDSIARDLDHIMKFIPPNQRVLSLVYDEDDGIHQAHALRSILLLYQARKGGYMPEGFTRKNDVMPVRRKIPKIAPFWRNPRSFRYARYAHHYDYFLVVLPRKSLHDKWETFPGAGKNVQLLAKKGRFAAYDNLGLR